jgi:hypothetical protein
VGQALARQGRAGKEVVAGLEGQAGQVDGSGPVQQASGGRCERPFEEAQVDHFSASVHEGRPVRGETAGGVRRAILYVVTLA